ncbi:MAG: hypothetical protein JSW07_23100 [bacterium]|nr:MAG: hypothetical protein JSW07_23100 [bacterium]
MAEIKPGNDLKICPTARIGQKVDRSSATHFHITSQNYCRDYHDHVWEGRVATGRKRFDYF